MNKHTKNKIKIAITILSIIVLLITMFEDYDSPWTYVIWNISFIWLTLFVFINRKLIFREVVICDACAKVINGTEYYDVNGNIVCEECMRAAIDDIAENSIKNTDAYKRVKIETIENLRRIASEYRKELQ